MFAQKTILIVEDEPGVAMGLSSAIEKLDGIVIGPVPTVSEALVRLERDQIAAAILEANLADRDVTPLALLLAKRRVPFLIHTAVAVPPALHSALPDVPIILKPYDPELVVTRLAEEIRRWNDIQTLFPPGRNKRSRTWLS